MQPIQKLSSIAGILILAGFIPSPARAEINFSDITGTNYWNNVAPAFYDDYKPAPELLDRINRINQEGQAAFQACNAAIAQLEQSAPTPRRFARKPAPPAEVPAACQQLESLRAEAAEVQLALEELDRTRPKPETRAW
jgi:hypothetical protein